ncbi:unnamed protein product, partial [Tetraodon nigroviridis]
MKTRPAGIGRANADWMGSLSPKLSAMPLKHLAVPEGPRVFQALMIPSPTGWTCDAPVGPDQKLFVKYLATMFSVFAKKVMVKWSMTQFYIFTFKLCSTPQVKDGLLEINSFLSRHRKEVVLLDFNHHYAMDAAHHVYLITMLQEVFGNRLCHDCAVETVTLNYLWGKKHQVIVFYHHPSAQHISVMWPGSKIPAPWANTTDPSKLIQFLETTLKERDKKGSFHVSQAILTPRVNTVAKGLVWGLRNYLVERSANV